MNVIVWEPVVRLRTNLGLWNAGQFSTFRTHMNEPTEGQKVMDMDIFSLSLSPGAKENFQKTAAEPMLPTILQCPSPCRGEASSGPRRG